MNQQTMPEQRNPRGAVRNGGAALPISSWDSKPSFNPRDFLCALFEALESNNVRYCVLHSWEELPEKLSSDLDIAVHPDDSQKLSSAFRSLHEQGYTPVQVLNYFVGAYGFFFCWFNGLTMNTIIVDVIFEHRRGGLIVPSGDELVLGRSRHGLFWVPAPEAEFVYLLAKKTWKGRTSARQERRLRALVHNIGRPRAERLASRLFLGNLSVRVVEACAKGQLDALLAQLRSQTWQTSIARNPLKLAAYLFSDTVRRVRRYLQPTGLLVVILGPDGAGKSTLIEHLVRTVGPAFRRHKVFHWRPMLLWRRRTTSDTTHPHGMPPHGRWWSLARLFAHLLDYWVGFCLLIRPLLARSGLVVFDRYYYDLLADPKRYRFGGPLWLARAMGRFVPNPDLLFVLDAPVPVILSRKREIEPDSILSQRQGYLRLARGLSQAHVVDAEGPISCVVAQVARIIREYLARRFERCHADWLAMGPASLEDPSSRPAGVNP